MSQSQPNPAIDLIAAIQTGLLGKRGDSYNVLRVAELVAAFESARYYEEHMVQCAIANNAAHLLQMAIGWRQVPGLILEFGVASGATINHLAQLAPDDTLFGFDWFNGLPEIWRPGFGKGAFAQHVPAVRDNVELVPGLFDQTLPDFVAAHPGPIALLHVDCDLYSSTRTVFRFLDRQIVPGTVIVFDEYFNYPGWLQHEFKAFQEYVVRAERRYEYLGFVPSHQQVCVRITA